MDASGGGQGVHIDGLLLQICSEWDKAEEDIKLTEQLNNKVVFPSIKELRYAGRRAIEVIKKHRAGADFTEIEALYRDIKFDCHRARHDAIDAGTAKIASDIELMTKKLGYNSILKVYPDFGQLHRDLESIRTQIAVSRGNTVNRNHIYQEIEDGKFPALVSKFRDLQTSESVIKGHARGERRHAALIAGVGVIEIIVILLVCSGLLIDHWNWVTHHI